MAREYAWGEDRICGRSCPAISAGYDMAERPTKRVAERYDVYASHYPQLNGMQGEGIIASKDARHAWLDTIEHLNERIQDGYDEVGALHLAALIYRNEWGDDL